MGTNATIPIPNPLFYVRHYYPCGLVMPQECVGTRSSATLCVAILLLSVVGDSCGDLIVSLKLVNKHHIECVQPLCVVVPITF